MCIHGVERETKTVSTHTQIHILSLSLHSLSNTKCLPVTKIDHLAETPLVAGRLKIRELGPISRMQEISRSTQGQSPD
mgnify:CR=1 FL=1